MDLSVPLPVPAGDASLPAADMALLISALSGRPSATTLAQAAVDAPPAGLVSASLLMPLSGAFNDAMAARLTAWKRS